MSALDSWSLLTIPNELLGIIFDFVSHDRFQHLLVCIRICKTIREKILNLTTSVHIHCDALRKGDWETVPARNSVNMHLIFGVFSNLRQLRFSGIVPARVDRCIAPLALQLYSLYIPNVFKMDTGIFYMLENLRSLKLDTSDGFRPEQIYHRDVLERFACGNKLFIGNPEYRNLAHGPSLDASRFTKLFPNLKSLTLLNCTSNSDPIKSDCLSKLVLYGDDRALVVLEHGLLPNLRHLDIRFLNVKDFVDSTLIELEGDSLEKRKVVHRADLDIQPRERNVCEKCAAEFLIFTRISFDGTKYILRKITSLCLTCFTDGPH